MSNLHECKRPSLQISIDRLCRLKASLQNQKYKIESNIFEAESLAQGYWSLHQQPETGIFRATPMKEYN